MRFDLTRQHLAFSVAFVALLALFGSALAAYSSTSPGHPLSQVYTGTTTRTGVDDGISGVSGTAGDGKIDLANDAERLGGVAAANYIQRSCVTVTDDNGASVTTSVSSSNTKKRAVIPTGLCRDVPCTIVLTTANSANPPVSNIALTTYIQRSTGGKWAALQPGGLIAGSDSTSAHDGTNGDQGSGSEVVIMRDAPTSGSAKILLRDDEANTETSAAEWSLEDTNSNWGVTLLQVCSS